MEPAKLRIQFIPRIPITVIFGFSFSEGSRAELEDSGVTVTTIAPGLMRTGSHNAALSKGNQEAESTYFSLASSLPLASMSGARAARQIVSAVSRGESMKLLTTPASLLTRINGLAAGLTQEMIKVVSSASTEGRSQQVFEGRLELEGTEVTEDAGSADAGHIAARRLNERKARV